MVGEMPDDEEGLVPPETDPLEDPQDDPMDEQHEGLDPDDPDSVQDDMKED
jgi:hypothetical protein